MKTSIPKLHSIKMKNHYNVVNLDIVTSKDLDPQRVLIGAINHNLEGVVVIGYDKQGYNYFASSYADGGTVLWLMEHYKLALLGG